jgi:hypothetical protein
VDTILLPTEEEVQQRLDATAGGNEGDEWVCAEVVSHGGWWRLVNSVKAWFKFVWIAVDRHSFICYMHVWMEFGCAGCNQMLSSKNWQFNSVYLLTSGSPGSWHWWWRVGKGSGLKAREERCLAGSWMKLRASPGWRRGRRSGRLTASRPAWGCIVYPLRPMWCPAWRAWGHMLEMSWCCPG